jgi:vacuolar-type H+-ATPase subunit F/Vma7
MSVESRRVVVVSSREHEFFYKLLGLKDVVVAGREGLGELVNKLKKEKDVAVILIEESLAREAGLDVFSLNEKGFSPLVTIVPDSKVSLESDPKAYYLKFASQIIGYELGV